MSFSAAPSFDPNVGTPATPAQSAGQPAAPGVAFADQNGNAYTGQVGGINPEDNGFSPVQSPIAGRWYNTPDNDKDQAFAYDTSKYSSPALAYLDNLSGWGVPTTGAASMIQGLNIDPTAALAGYKASGADSNWTNGPYGILEDIVRGNPALNTSSVQNFLSSSNAQQNADIAANFGSNQYDTSHPAQSMTGMNYLTDVVIPAVTMGLGAVGGFGALLDGSAALPEAGISSGMAEMFPEAGASFAGPGASLTTTQALQNAGESLAKKIALQQLSGKKSSTTPTDFIKPAGDVLSTFADGGSVDSTDFFPDDLSDPGASDPGNFDFPSVDPSPTTDPNLAYGDPAAGAYSGSGLSMGLVGPQAPVNDPENQGTMGNMSGYSPKTADTGSPNAPPSAATGASQSVIGTALQKLGYMNANGDVDLGKALKAGATVAALAVTYLNNKKLASQGAQLAAAQVQPGQVFTLPNTALSNYPGAPYAVGHPTNSNSTVQLRAEGGALMRHHLAMGGPPMGGPLGSPTGAMPPQMMPQGGMSRMPGASPQGPGGMPPPPGGMGGNPAQQAPTMPMGVAPSWQGMAPPPSATPMPANHFAHGGALTMAQHAQNYQGHAAQRDQVTSGYGAVRGPGGGQDDIVDARMAPGEYVFDADTVAALGDGSSEEGARRLDAWRKHLREHKRSAPATEIPPKAHAAPHYLGGAR